MTSESPLRYPGGKQVLAGVLASLIKLNGLENGLYAEPYAGGAGAALSLLFSGHVKKLLLNDADPCIFSMWKSILLDTDSFLTLLERAPVTIKEWRKQKTIYSSPRDYSSLQVGFATFFLNRTNRSGIIKNAGPIGGYDQTGAWKVDARFNKTELARRIEKIGMYRNRISFTNLDAMAFLKQLKAPESTFVYLDPPYFVKGRELYLNHYVAGDHEILARFMKVQPGLKWIMSYDAAEEIEELYSSFRQVRFTLSYSATTRKAGNELLILGRGLKFPPKWRVLEPAEFIRLAS
jgi:DNA adenine methylase